MDGEAVVVRVERLRAVLMYASLRGYDGPGMNWPWSPSADLPGILERGEHIPILKSDDFMIKFLGNPLAAITTSGGPLRLDGMIVQRAVGDPQRRRLRQLDDPLDEFWALLPPEVLKRPGTQGS